MIKINNNIDWAELAQKFKAQKRIRIRQFLQPQSITALAELAEQTEFANAFFLDGLNREASDQQIAALQPQQRRELYQQIYQQAAKGVGFLYGRHKVELAQNNLFSKYLHFINSESLLDLIKNVTGNANLSGADGQVTRYRVGDFLTRHRDDPANDTRQFAYVLGLSPNWHPDWGGLLQFYQNNGQPEQAFAPEFNSLTLFDVTQVHAVTSIAAFAPAHRYSITGWFRV